MIIKGFLKLLISHPMIVVCWIVSLFASCSSHPFSCWCHVMPYQKIYKSIKKDLFSFFCFRVLRPCKCCDVVYLVIVAIKASTFQFLWLLSPLHFASKILITHKSVLCVEFLTHFGSYQNIYLKLMSFD